MFSVYYDGKKMWSRLGNAFTPPKEFLDRTSCYDSRILVPLMISIGLPKDVTLDGEVRNLVRRLRDEPLHMFPYT